MSLKIALVLILVLTACMSSAVDVHSQRFIGEFYEQSIPDQVRKFGDYKINDQYDLYIFGNSIVHPPATYLAKPFARQGASIVPFLEAKLKSESNEARIRDIVLVFTEMARLHVYDFSQNKELVALLNKKVDGMRGMWKEVAHKFLLEIQNSMR